ncbi:MAG: hypothetical protein Faunusvirus16_3 [Faunusvirus sp.]|jgi:TPR repeat protein|uniref:Sel1 repeat protein n=1 Tax=Faunusvirus sp. TaxID=2487766 RepID=A0A3G5A1U8_9VIRU|nr:MAG: hypothetical protein Faunusvirus16_3 [Faunusvirus sp.]
MNTNEENRIRIAQYVNLVESSINITVPYVKIEDNLIKKIYDLLIDSKTYISDVQNINNTVIELYFHGLYYFAIGDKLFEKYFLAASAKKHGESSYFMAQYYDLNNNLEYKITYLDLASKQGYVEASFELGEYYNKHDKFKEMEPYYKKAAKENHVESMYKLGLYYYKISKFDEMKKYYRQACENEDIKSMVNLGNYYKEYKEYDNMFKYYKMIIDDNDDDAETGFNLLESFCKEMMK